MKKYMCKWTQMHPNNLVTHGATQPILTVLDVHGFELRDMFLMGFNDNCGSIIVPTEQRVRELQAALEPAYAVTKIKRLDDGDWSADYDRRELNGSVPGHFVTDITLKDGTVAMKDGRRQPR